MNNIRVNYILDNLSYQSMPLNSIGITNENEGLKSLIIYDYSKIIHSITSWPIQIIFKYGIIDNKILLYEVFQRDLISGLGYHFKWKEDKSFYCDEAEGFTSKCMMFKNWDEYFNIEEVRDYVISKGGSFSNDN